MNLQLSPPGLFAMDYGENWENSTRSNAGDTS